MTVGSIGPDNAGEHQTEDPWVCIRTDSFRPVADWSLVLAAMSIDHRIEQTIEQERRRWRLLVRAEKAPYAEAQLYAYDQENVPTHAPEQGEPPIDSGWAGIVGFLLVIWSVPALSAYGALGWHWRDLGVMDAGRLMDGEWWRAITALTLHGDIGHIVGNSVFGLAFGLVLGRHLGSGFGWLLAVIAGALGNVLNAWLQPDAFRSIGASTMTFAMLGIISGFVWRRGYFRHITWRRSVAPLFAAFALFALTGTGGENTDVGAHITGLAMGLIAGIAASYVNIVWLATSGQRIAGGGALLLVAAAWLAARGA